MLVLLCYVPEQSSLAFDVFLAVWTSAALGMLD